MIYDKGFTQFLTTHHCCFSIDSLFGRQDIINILKQPQTIRSYSMNCPFMWDSSPYPKGPAPWRRRLQGLVQQYGVVVGYGGKRENVLNHSNIFVVIIITTINILITISLKICTGYRSCVRLSRSRGFHSFCGYFGLEICIWTMSFHQYSIITIVEI